MVTTYNPTNPDIRGFIHKNWNIIENTEELKDIFPEKPLIGFKRLPNLRNKLTSNTVEYPTKQANKLRDLPPVCTRLGKCTYCPLLQKISDFKGLHTGKTHKTVGLTEKHRITCEMYDVIYIVQSFIQIIHTKT